MRTVWLMIVVGLVVSAVGVVSAGSAEEAKKTDIPLYDGKPGTKIGDVCVNPKDGAEMVWVPAGEFLMGSTDWQIAVAFPAYAEFIKEARDVVKFYLDDEKPQRKVYLDGYWMYKTEVTVAQYRKFCEATDRQMPKAPDWGWKDDHPMVNVSWQDAVDYAKWADVSLPTEAQWEKASRGTDGRIYPWGNKWDASKCANSVAEELKGTKPVGRYTADASPYGCLDMAGNVFEWCVDWYDPDYYQTAPSRNPKGPSKAVAFTIPGLAELTSARVLRGGSWHPSSFIHFRCAYRILIAFPDFPNYAMGFRCARTP